MILYAKDLVFSLNFQPNVFYVGSWVPIGKNSLFRDNPLV